MNISIVGPEGSGKTTLQKFLAKRAAFTRPIFYNGKLKSEYPILNLKDFHKQRNTVNLFDDTNAIIESYEVYTKDLNLKEPIIMSRHWNNLNIFIFHSMDDSVKFFFRQSRYVYVSDMYKDSNYTKNKYIKGIEPVIVGKGKYLFKRFKRY